jgi:adenine-specific DNA-methyltransferase
MTTAFNTALLQTLDTLNAAQLRRLLTEHLTEKKLGLYWESNAIERDAALNSHIVLPRLVAEKGYSHHLENIAVTGTPNLIIEGDNFDSLRLLKSTHAGKIRVIYIDPPYNTGNKDWVYNDHYVGANDRWRHSQWLEFLYRRLLLAKDLLTQDGVIMVSINDENRARLELLMDEVFPMRRVGSFVWRVRSGGNDTKGALLSNNHEHILIYANAGFEFKGEGRDESAYGNPDNDPRGEWTSGDLNKAHNAKQRPEAYYSIHNPETNTWYLCDPDSVWRFSSISRPLKKKLQSDPIEVILNEKRILWPNNEKSILYSSINEIHSAIKQGTAPKQLKIYSELTQLKKSAEKDVKIQRLLNYIEPLENWVGRKIGFGKPRYKRFRSQLLRDVKPLSSWLHAAADKQIEDDDEDDEFVNLSVGATGEGTAQVKALLGNKDFEYPKPLSLIQNLLSQATRAGDIVLDFFAGSGTTGHAVLALNALEPNAAPRSFILCSSTEATTKEPDKNLCRDVCAARIRKVIESDSKLAHNHFAYLQLEKIVPSDTPFETDRAHAFQLLTLRLGKVARPLPQDELAQQGIYLLLQNTEDGALTVYIDQPTPSALDALATLKAPLRIYSTRPDTVKKHLNKAWAKTDKTFEAISLHKALVHGQVVAKEKKKRR